MDLTIDVEDYKLNIRSAGIILHNNNVLLHKNNRENHYALLGGRVEVGENSQDTVIREIKEELGKDVEVIGYIATIENFFKMKGKKYHEIMFVYQVEFKDENDKKIDYELNNIEGKDYLKYKWVNLNEISKCNILPIIVKDILAEGKFPVHRINNELD